MMRGRSSRPSAARSAGRVARPFRLDELQRKSHILIFICLLFFCRSGCRYTAEAELMLFFSFLFSLFQSVVVVVVVIISD